MSVGFHYRIMEVMLKSICITVSRLSVLLRSGVIDELSRNTEIKKG